VAAFAIFGANAQHQITGFQKSYAFKWNPSGLYFGKIALQTEYNFKKKKSFTFDLGIPYNKTIIRNINNEDKSLALKTFSVKGGYRMYLGKKTMTGVYFEPYLKYLKNDASTSFRSNNNTAYVLTSSYSGVGLGAQLGVQFMIAKRLTFDFFFLGPEANTVHHKAILQDISTTKNWDDHDAQNKRVTSSYNGFLPGFRFGLSVGWHF